MTEEPFVCRHLGPNDADRQRMLTFLGYDTIDHLLADALPASIRATVPLRLPAARSQTEVLDDVRRLATLNEPMVQMIGLGYFDTITPAVIRRGVLESPAWYTAYTPYQPEISQGRLEALLTFQTVIEDLTGLPIANASLLDEPSAAAEAMLLMRRAVRDRARTVIALDEECLPQTTAIVQARAAAVGLDVIVIDPLDPPEPAAPMVGLILQQVACSGRVRDLRGAIAWASAQGAMVTMAADPLALTLLTPPGELGADIAIGSAQRFGVPLFFGGPHAAFMAVRSGLERQLPGRLVGVSVDAEGKPAYRLALQTREQHIRREKATSNICTAQALLAVVAAMYAVYHGPEGLTAIARRVHGHAERLADDLRRGGFDVVHSDFFDTVLVSVPGRADELVGRAAAVGINIRRVDADAIAIACDEATTAAHLDALLAALGAAGAAPHPPAVASRVAEQPGSSMKLPAGLVRTSAFLLHPVFHEHRSETALMRYLHMLSDRDLALDRTMIPLGSCTMKLNPAVTLEPITWPGFAGIHPFAPADQCRGYLELVDTLSTWLAEITGYDAVSVQPNAGSQGELAGLAAIRAYHAARGAAQRNLCLIPTSAHGTNAASAVLAGLTVAAVRTGEDGAIDLPALRAQLADCGDRVAAIMLTYPSTHGVYEDTVVEVCEAVHAVGGQVYIDGANLNALIGLARPGDFGGDVSHLNLHKTFAIPHGGGGPGVGPVAAKAHLAPFLPADPLATGTKTQVTAALASVAERGAAAEPAGPPVAGSRWGSAGILPVSYAFIALLGADGLSACAHTAVLSANYLARRLGDAFPILYTGDHGLVAHECILDLRPLTKRTGVTAEDVAKRLIDFGFHAPTMAFPVPGTLMVEPTESENLAELDRFCEAMLAIATEADQIAAGEVDLDASALRRAPHTIAAIVADEWNRPYPRSIAATPSAATRAAKYWPPVARIDNAYGDRHLQCACPPVSAFAETEDTDGQAASGAAAETAEERP